jgi:hypothetical protein
LHDPVLDIGGTQRHLDRGGSRAVSAEQGEGRVRAAWRPAVGAPRERGIRRL